MPYVPYHRQVPKKPYFVKEEATPEAGPAEPPSVTGGVFWGLWLFILSVIVAGTVLPVVGAFLLILLGFFIR